MKLSSLSLAAVLAAAAQAACAPSPGTLSTPPPASAAGSAPGELPRTHAPRPTSPEIRTADLTTRLYLVADDSMQGRRVGEPGNVMATDYIAAEFRRLGLEPAGENGTYFQTVPIVRRELDPASSLQVDGTVLRPWTDFVLRDQGPGARSLDGVQAVFAGTWGDEGSMIPAAGAAGKLVVVGVRAGAGGRVPWNIRRAVAPRYPAAAGIAVAALEVVPEETVESIREPGLQLAAGAGAPTPSFLWISRATARALLGAPLEGMQPGSVGRTVRGTVRYVQTPAPAPARNVIAILRGSDPAARGQYVAIGAHNDHEGVAAEAVDHDSLRAYNRVMRPQGANDEPGNPTAAQWSQIRSILASLRATRPARRDSIYNGADDDGSGTVVLLEIAEALATSPARPRRSILFVSHTGEEAGLLGSQWFTDHPTVPRDSIVAALNMDMVGRGRPEDIAGGGPGYIQLIGSRRLSTELGDLIDSLNRARPDPMRIDYSFDAPRHPLNRYCRSDHYMYARYGIPITYLSRGYHIDYHMVSDEPQYIDYEGMTTVAGFVRDILVAVANRDRRLVVDKPKPDPNAPCQQ
ncbi:MAG TPA: M28 family peptidase [Longimicrobiaceae bacterium]|nr:M28 family peptidase [Longimicrobiaceae bacterium]